MKSIGKKISALVNNIFKKIQQEGTLIFKIFDI